MKIPSPTELRNFIVQRFNRAELNILCSDEFQNFYHDYDDMPITSTEMAEKLVQYCIRHGKLKQLRDALHVARSKPYEESFGAFIATEIHVLLGEPMIQIPSSEGIIGSGNDDTLAWDDEKPQTLLRFDDFLISRHPITVHQFALFVNATKYRTTSEKKGEGYSRKNGHWQMIKGADWQHPYGPKSNVLDKANHPVTQVSLEDALAYCRWLQSDTPLSEGKVSLPTEAEWERAARGEKKVAAQYIYPWGNQRYEREYAHLNIPEGDTCPVGENTLQSPSGCFDMAGNVWEWTSSQYRAYPYDAHDGREVIELDDNKNYVLRGASFFYSPEYARSAGRIRASPYLSSAMVGFRIKLNLK